MGSSVSLVGIKNLKNPHGWKTPSRRCRTKSGLVMDNNSRLFFALKNARHVKKGRLIQPAVKKGKSMHQKETRRISMDIKTNGTFENHIFYITSPDNFNVSGAYVSVYHDVPRKEPMQHSEETISNKSLCTKTLQLCHTILINSEYPTNTQISSIHFFVHIISPTEKPPCSNLVRGWNTLKHHMSSYLTPTRNTKIAVDSLYKISQEYVRGTITRGTLSPHPSPAQGDKHLTHGKIDLKSSWLANQSIPITIVFH